MELDTEKFKALKELAELQMALSSGQTELKNLHESIDSFRADREKEALDVVQRVLLASRAAIAEAQENADVVAALLRDAKDIVEKLKVMTEAVEAIQKDQLDAADKVQTQVAETLSNLSTVSANLKKERSHLQDERKNLDIAQQELHKGQLLLKDRNEMLRQDIERIKKLKLPV